MHRVPRFASYSALSGVLYRAREASDIRGCIDFLAYWYSVLLPRKLLRLRGGIGEMLTGPVVLVYVCWRRNPCRLTCSRCFVQRQNAQHLSSLITFEFVHTVRNIVLAIAAVPHYNICRRHSSRAGELYQESLIFGPVAAGWVLF